MAGNFFDAPRYARDGAGDESHKGQLKRIMHEQRFRVADGLNVGGGGPASGRGGREAERPPASPGGPARPCSRG